MDHGTRPSLPVKVRLQLPLALDSGLLRSLPSRLPVALACIASAPHVVHRADRLTRHPPPKPNRLRTRLVRRPREVVGSLLAG